MLLLPDRYAWTIYTMDQPDHYVFDGGTTSSFIGGRLLGRERGATPLRSHARFAAVQDLDTLLLPGVSVAPLAPADRPAGTAAAVAVTFADDGARYRVGFDDDGRLVVVEGPLELPPFGHGVVEARVTEFRTMGGMTLPARVTYRLAGETFADERTLAACPNPPGLDPAAFASPEALPRCPIAPD